MNTEDSQLESLDNQNYEEPGQECVDYIMRMCFSLIANPDNNGYDYTPEGEIILYAIALAEDFRREILSTNAPHPDFFYYCTAAKLDDNLDYIDDFYRIAWAVARRLLINSDVLPQSVDYPV